MSSWRSLRYYDDNTKHLSDKQLQELAKRVDKLDTEHCRENGGQGDYNVILAREAHRMRFGKNSNY